MERGISFTFSSNLFRLFLFSAYCANFSSSRFGNKLNCVLFSVLFARNWLSSNFSFLSFILWRNYLSCIFRDSWFIFVSSLWFFLAKFSSNFFSSSNCLYFFSYFKKSGSLNRRKVTFRLSKILICWKTPPFFACFLPILLVCLEFAFAFTFSYFHFLPIPFVAISTPSISARFPFFPHKYFSFDHITLVILTIFSLFLQFAGSFFPIPPYTFRFIAFSFLWVLSLLIDKHLLLQINFSSSFLFNVEL